MSDHSVDKAFSGSIPAVYERYLVPLLFQPYADDLVNRMKTNPPSHVLEVAAGTGVVTRAMAKALPKSTQIIATDLNPGMIEQATSVEIARPVERRQADAIQLPFEAGTFDTVVCQFGVMFFPDKPKAHAETLRVLKPGGRFLFNVWDSMETNPIAAVITSALAQMFPADPPQFLPRTPFGYYDRARLAQDLAAGGFTAAPEIITVPARSRAASAQDVAIAYCQGTPLRAEIETRDPSKLQAATDASAAAVAARFGNGAIDVPMQAVVVVAQK